MGSARVIVVATVAVTLAVLVPAGSLAAADAAPGPLGPAHSTTASAPRTDNTVTRIAVQSDGDARWRVRIRTRLSTDGEVDQYRAFQAEFRNDTGSYLGPFADRIRGVVNESANATGREMRARNFSASTSIQELPRRWGVVTFAFTWTNFARTDGDALVVGDVFEGGFLLARNDSLVVTAPEGYAVASADPAPESRESDSVTWEGQRSFGDRRPRVRLEPTAPTATATPTPDGGGSGLPWTAVVALLAAGLAGGAALHRSGRAPWTDRAGSPPDVGGESAAGDEEGAAGGTGDAEAPVLTDGERVERLLADAGGRMKQADVADELGWSASKTSRVVSSLVEAGRVEKLRVGRENVLDLVDDEE